jgi:3-dehydroquinate synthase
MPTLFDVRSASSVYSVVREYDVIESCASRLRVGMVIADSYFTPRVEALGVSVIALEANEASKNFDALGEIILRMRRAGANRDTHLWAIGGGIIQDVVAFIASVYMRGIHWTYVPTTLLGMVDSCIGGKSSINVASYKNILGTFHPPTMVLIDPLMTSSLSIEQRVAGLVEAAKICFCRGPDVFNAYLARQPTPRMNHDQLEVIIELSLTAKKWFVEIDEYDRAERLLLNLGHTFGHALEGASQYRIAHGIAVGFGILCALELTRITLAEPAGGCAPQLEAHVAALIATLPHLAEIIRSVEVDQVFERLEADKKHEPAHYRFVAFGADGAVRIVRLPKDAHSRALIVSAVSRVMESLGR